MQKIKVFLSRIGERWIMLICAAAIASLVAGCGEKKTKVHRVGILSGLDFAIAIAEGFKSEMTGLGYEEGRNIVYDLQRVNFDPAGERRIAEKFVTGKVDLILVYPSEASLTAKAVAKGTDVPVVFANANIEGVDLVESVRQPGGNITGVRYPGPDIAFRRLEILVEMVPHAKRIYVPYQRDYPTLNTQLEILNKVALSLGVVLIEAPVSSAAELQADLQARAESGDIGMDAILLIIEPITVKTDAFAVYGKFAAEHNIPVGGALMVADDYGTIFGLSTNKASVGRQTARLADKILRGTPAGTIPVVSAESYLRINYRMVQKLSLEVPEELLELANEIIR